MNFLKIKIKLGSKFPFEIKTKNIGWFKKKIKDHQFQFFKCLRNV
jgi:hypothetical protein